MYGELYLKIFVEKVSDIFKVLKLTCHIVGILEFPAFSEIHAFKNDSHIVAIFEVTKIRKLISQSKAI